MSIFCLFHEPTLCVFMNSVGRVMSTATVSKVLGLSVLQSVSKNALFLYGVSMKICVWLSSFERASSFFIILSRSGFFTGRYPLKAKLCPLSPLAIKESKIDDGPTSGITVKPALCALRATLAPGSATPGQPASEITPKSVPFFKTSN